MTEYEMNELVLQSLGLVQDNITLYLTIMSGFLLVMFLQAKNLSKYQFYFINMIFLVFSSFVIFGAYRFAINATLIGEGSPNINVPIWYSYFILTVGLICIIASMIFALSVRYNKAK
ncbi:hypothetical protein GAB14E_1880 [Colwellia psychrerythraea]|uniref:Uncharacterized protein n=1 Tax=Colwellia psychrerythraea TaxID=28229 RepID=A0A099KZT1_COLPS|nr:hypothetical protein GAB14E_1880 [Colwellia psychrerythraea]